MRLFLVRVMIFSTIIFLFTGCDDINLLRAAYDGPKYITSIQILHKGPMYPIGAADTLQLQAHYNTGPSEIINDPTNTLWEKVTTYSSVTLNAGTGGITINNDTMPERIQVTYKGLSTVIDIIGSNFVCVSTAGSDLAATIGSSGDPYRTISHALNNPSGYLVNAIHVAQGTYNETIAYTAPLSLFGGYSNDFRSVSANPELTHIVGDPSDAWAIRTGPPVNNSQIIECFTIERYGAPGAATFTAAIYLVNSGLTLKNNRILAGTNGGGINSTAIRVNNPAKTVVERNYIHGGYGNISCGIGIGGVGFEGPIINNVIVGGAGSDRSHGITLNEGTPPIIIRNNTIDGGTAPTGAYAIAASSSGHIIDNNILTYNSTDGTCYTEYIAGSIPGSFKNNNLFGANTYLYGSYISITAMESYLSAIIAKQNQKIPIPFSGSDYRFAFSSPIQPVCEWGLDGAAEGWSYTNDKDGRTRTPGWSMGAYEVNP